MRGGYFFLPWMNRLQIPMITRHNCKTSDVLIGQPPFLKIRGQKPPPYSRANRLPLLAALKGDPFLWTG